MPSIDGTENKPSLPTGCNRWADLLLDICTYAVWTCTCFTVRSYLQPYIRTSMAMNIATIRHTTTTQPRCIHDQTFRTKSILISVNLLRDIMIHRFCSNGARGSSKIINTIDEYDYIAKHDEIMLYRANRDKNENCEKGKQKQKQIRV